MKVIVISGPTASGKTDTSIELAKKLGGEIVNFDSLLLYKEITIGTAKPTKEEQGEIPHHMIDVASIADPLNAAAYAKMALPIIQNLHASGKLVYLVGGSGFYLQALLHGMYDSPTTPKEITERSDALYNSEGIKPFLEILKNEDPASFERYHENDHYRMRRAVEHFWSTGSRLSDARVLKDKDNLDRNNFNIHGWDILHIHLDVPKEEHFEIIKKRSIKMLGQGLIQEAKELLEKSFTGGEKPLQSIGYKEVIGLISGEITDEAQCLERIIISTRQLAKSQRTWFNRVSGKSTYHPLQDRQKIVDEAIKFVS